MADQETDDGTVWCEVCQQHVPADYAHAHKEPLPDEAREQLRGVLKRRAQESDG